MEIESKIEFARGWERESRELLFMGTRLLFGMIKKKVLEMDSGDGFTTL